MEQIKKIHYNRKKVLGLGGFGVVFRGTYEDEEVAVKRILLTDAAEREIQLKFPLDHENVLKILCVEENEDYRYIVLELCAGTLVDFCQGKYQGPNLPSDLEIVHQIIKGLNYLHSENLVHRDINPKKILISKTDPIRVKLSGFVMSKEKFKEMSEEMSSSEYLSMSTLTNFNWMAPELLNRLLNGSPEMIKDSSSSDIFSAGCVIFYFVTRGTHPFGDHISDVLKNITENKPVNIKRHRKDSDPARQFLIDITSEMIEGDPGKRSSLEKVLKKTGKFIETASKSSSETYPKNFTGEIKFCKTEADFLGQGSFGTVYCGTYRGNDVAVKTIELARLDKKDREVALQTQLSSDNVLKIWTVEEDNNFRYIVLELCAGTLEDVCKGKYQGPTLPSDENVVQQIIKGLNYLHSENLVHRDIKPENILISKTIPIIVKLSDFGMSKKMSSSGNFSWSGGFKGTQYWMAPELLKRSTEMIKGSSNRIKSNRLHNGSPEMIKVSKKSDIFSAGCVIFYFVTRGVHPFGDFFSVPHNITQHKAVNIEQHRTVSDPAQLFLIDIARDMIEGDPEKRSSLVIVLEKTGKFIQTASKSSSYTYPKRDISEIKFSKTEADILGQGTFGTVYCGTYRGNDVAVKTIELVRLDKKDRKVKLQTQLSFDNVLKIWTVEEDDNFRYIVLELCAGTLEDVCKGKYQGPTLPSDENVVQQIIKGLNYLHLNSLVHRDIKPANILISKTIPVRVKLSDFGMSKEMSSSGNFSLTSGIKGTECWIAPELLNILLYGSPEMIKVSRSSDIFSAGCVIFYFVTRGTHPFGHHRFIVQINVIKHKPVNIERCRQDSDPARQFLIDIASEMIEGDPVRRSSLDNVLKKIELRQQQKMKPFTEKFKEVVRSISGNNGYCVNRFHPTEPVLACGVDDKVILLSAANWSIPFSNWSAREIQLHGGIITQIYAMEWNLDGTQLAAICNDDDDDRCVVIVWNYPSGEILFQMNLPVQCDLLKWNPFRPNVFATFRKDWYEGEYHVDFFNCCPVDQRTFHFYKIRREERILSVEWISENRVAVVLSGGNGIKIYKIYESTGTVQEVQKLELDEWIGDVVFKKWISDVVWNERTKCLATSFYHLRDGMLEIFSMDSDQPIHRVEVVGRCRNLAWRPNGKETDDEGIDAARKSPDNFILACGLDDGRIVIWTPLEKETTRLLYEHYDSVHSLSFSPDGRFLVSADVCRKLIIWSTENWNSIDIGEGRWESSSWMSPSTDVPEYKLTFNSFHGKVQVIESVVGDCEIPN